MDLLSPLLSLEDSLYARGHALGTTDGERAGRIEGRRFGLERGFERFSKLGRVYGRGCVWGARVGMGRVTDSSMAGHVDDSTGGEETRVMGKGSEERGKAVEGAEDAAEEGKTREDVGANEGMEEETVKDGEVGGELPIVTATSPEREEEQEEDMAKIKINNFANEQSVDPTLLPPSFPIPPTPSSNPSSPSPSPSLSLPTSTLQPSLPFPSTNQISPSPHILSLPALLPSTSSPNPKLNRLNKHLSTLLSLSEPATFSLTNTEDAVADYDNRFRRAGVKAGIVGRMVGEEIEGLGVEEGKGKGGVDRVEGVERDVEEMGGIKGVMEKGGKRVKKGRGGNR